MASLTELRAGFAEASIIPSTGNFALPLVLLTLLALPLFTGCDFQGAAGRMIEEIPKDFKETAGDSKIAQQKTAVASLENPSLKISQIPGLSSPLCGAILRLDRNAAEGREEYREFLLPSIIIDSRNPHPSALTVQFGEAAGEVRTLVPAGGFHVGILPTFRPRWLATDWQGGARAVDIKVLSAWSRLRSDDLLTSGKVHVSSVYHFPAKHINPLVVSALDPNSKNLPEVAGPTGGRADVWAEAIFFETRLKGKGETGLSDNPEAWVFVRPPEVVSDADGATDLEAAVFVGSAALRDGIPCWLTFVGRDVFLMMGGLPPDEKSFVLSPSLLVSGAFRDSFEEFSRKSRDAYIDALTRAGTAKFLDVSDRKLFVDLPEAKRIQAEAGRGEAQRKPNPFDL